MGWALSELLVWGGALLLAMLAVSQTQKTWRNSASASGVLTATWTVVMFGAAALCAYAVVSRSYSIGVPSGVTALLAVFVLIRVAAEPAPYPPGHYVPSALTKAWERTDKKWQNLN
jgi:hypothetical protein